MDVEEVSAYQKLISALPTEPKAKGDMFERIIKWFLQNETIYNSKFKFVWLWNEWPERTGPDIGVDLVAEASNGELWAIQVKAYSEETTVTREDVAAFFDASSRIDKESKKNYFSGRILFTSNNSITRHARDAFSLSQIPSILIQGNLLEQFDWPIDLISDLNGVSSLPKTKLELRDYQVEALNSITDGFKTSDRGQLIMACGTGKTLVSIKAAEGIEARRILVLLPSISLLNQTLINWSRNFSNQFRWLAVCSDTSVDREMREDELIENVIDCGFPVTTDTQIIKNFLISEEYGIVFSTYQSAQKIAEAIQGTNFSFDLAVFDEAHKCAGAGNNTWSFALSNQNIPINKRLFCTATPRIVNSNDPELEVFSMSDRAIFGDVFFSFSFGKAIQQGYLSDYKIVIVGLDTDKYAKFISSSQVESNDKLYHFAFVASAVVLSKLIEKYKLRSVISFHSRIKRAEIFAREFPGMYLKVADSETFLDMPSIYASNISGDMPAWERNRKLSKLKNMSDNRFSLISNARCLTEGIDVPSLDGILFVDPKWSEVDIVQAVGRVIRKSESKRDGYVIIPITAPMSSENDANIDLSNFSLVWSVVNALKAHDDVLTEELAVMRRNIGCGKPMGEFPKKIIIDMSDTSFSSDLIRAIQDKLIKSTTSSWDEYFGALKYHFEKHGHSNIHRHGKGINSLQLGVWVVAQRVNRKKGKLDPRQIELLDSLSFRWEKDKDSWDSNFEEYAQRMEQNELENLSPKLRQWKIRVVRDFVKGNLTEERISKLEKIGFDFKDTAAERFNASWQKGLDAYFSNFGKRPTGEGPNSEYIKRWARIQRQNYSRGRLEPEKIKLLEARGFSWVPVNGEFGD